MATITLSPRKTDILDIWEKQCFERYEAYIQGDIEKAKIINAQLKDIRRNSGWTEMDIQQEFEVYDSLLETPYSPAVGNRNISYELIADNKGRKLLVTLSKLGIYWTYKKSGKTHTEALGYMQ